MLLSLLHWGLSLILGSLLVRALARREELVDGLSRGGCGGLSGSSGSVWAMGLSSSAAQLQANPASMPPALLQITGVIPFSETIFLWQSIVLTVVLIVVIAVDRVAHRARERHMRARPQHLQHRRRAAQRVDEREADATRRMARVQPAAQRADRGARRRLADPGIRGQGRGQPRSRISTPTTFFSDARVVAVLAAARVSRCRRPRRAERHRRADPVSVLRRHRRDHHQRDAAADGQRIAHHLSTFFARGGDPRDVSRS